MDYIQMGILGSILAIQSFFDIKKKEIPVLVTIAGVAAGALCEIGKGNFIVTQPRSLIPGILCLIFSKVSREALGYGDSLLICMMGLYLQAGGIISICMWAFILAGIVALFLFIFAKKKGKYEMPFVPFLLAAYVMEVIVGEIS